MHVFSYWSGPVSWMERLGIASAQAVGLDVTVFSHDRNELAREGLGCRVADAQQLLSDDPALERLRLLHPAHYTDHFRLAGLRHAVGTWIDLDLVFLKPLPSDPYLIGWETDRSVCNAVLRLPSGSAILDEYVTICQKRPLKLNVPWYPLGKRVHRHIKRVTHTLQGKMLAPLLGPITLTYLVRKHGLLRRVKPAPVFYPVPFGRTSIAKVADPGYIESCIRPETITVHLWRSLFRKVYGDTLPGPWLKSAMVRFLQSKAELAAASGSERDQPKGQHYGPRNVHLLS